MNDRIPVLAFSVGETRAGLSFLNLTLLYAQQIIFYGPGFSGGVLMIRCRKRFSSSHQNLSRRAGGHKKGTGPRDKQAPSSEIKLIKIPEMFTSTSESRPAGQPVRGPARWSTKYW